MYITILQGNMISPIRSAGINLQKSDKKAIVMHLMSMFSKFVNSNENLKLDNTFKVFFKIFSSNHVFDKTSRRKTHLITTLGNFKNNGQMLKGCIYLKSNFEKTFADCCLLTATLMGFLYNNYLYDGNKEFCKLRKLYEAIGDKKVPHQ